MNPDQMVDVPVQDALWRHAMASDADGLELHYVRWGQGTPQVLLLHGWPGFWYDWRRVLPRLAQFTSVIALDLRGFGFSAKPDWPVHSAYSPEAVVEAIRTVL
ncbi:MAG TPA: hypothetical protein DDW25_09740 [Ktedonobacter sp.]|nr:hypothetical protein [Ktedonobacter sp.]